MKLPSHFTDETRNRAIWYFRAHKPSHSVWHWDASAKKIIWVDDSLIATRHEILTVLHRLASRGLPRFGAIVLLLAALRGKSLSLWWGEPTEDQYSNFRVPSLLQVNGFEIYECQRVRMIAEPKTLSQVVQGLNNLWPMEEVCRKESDLSGALAEMLLAEPREAIFSEGIISMLAEGMLNGEELNIDSKYSSLFLDLAVFVPRLALLPPRSHGFTLDQLRNLNLEWRNKVRGATRSMKLHGNISVTRELELPSDAVWSDLVSFDWGFCVAGRRQNETSLELVLARYSWSGEHQIVTWPQLFPQTQLSFGVAGDNRLVVDRFAQPPLSQQVFPSCSNEGLPELIVGGAAWFPEASAGFACGETSIWFAQLVGDSGGAQFSLSVRQLELNTGHFRSLCELKEKVARSPIPMVLAGRIHPCMALGNRLLIYEFRGVMNWFDLPENVTRLIMAKVGQSSAVVACMEAGVAFHWLGTDETEVYFEDREKPVAGFTKGGELICLSGKEGMILKPAHPSSGACREFFWQEPAVRSLGRTNQEKDFAALTIDNRVLICTSNNV